MMREYRRGTIDHAPHQSIGHSEPNLHPNGAGSGNDLHWRAL